LKMFSVFLLFCCYLPFKMGNPLHLKKLESPSLKDDLFRVWLKLAQWFCRSFKRPHPIFTCSWLSPLWRGPGPLFEQIWFSFTKRWFVWSLIEFGQLVLEMIYKKNSVYFYSFAIISPWRSAVPFAWTNLNPLHPSMICAKSG
jgi:hypothetical protein